jgi:hypothetical protein
MPSAKKQVAKTSAQLLNALEEHLSTLVPMLAGLQSGDAAHIKDIVAKLRLLICGSSGQHGLLWDLGDETQANDFLQIRYAGKVDTNNPLTHKLWLLDNHALANLPGTPIPLEPISLREHITAHEAVFVDGVSLTYKELIKEMAEHSGTAHETPGISRQMAKANTMRLGDVQPCIPIVDRVARWTLTFGEIVIQQAVSQGYIRRRQAAIPPPEILLESIRFTYPMDGPVLDATGDEGTVSVWLAAADFVRAKEQASSVEFPLVSTGKISFSFLATRRGRLRINGTGLAIPNFGYEGAVVGNSAGMVGVAITWHGLDIQVFIDGLKVSGMCSP